MIRQCLYCAKELTKNSTSNFCSKECWTEYKRLKAMNIDVDKQSTVMIKKSDLSTPQETPMHSASSADISLVELAARISELEAQLQSRLVEISELESRLTAAPVQDPADLNNALNSISQRIAHLESNNQKIDALSGALSKVEDKINSLERKLKSIPSESSPAGVKKGFFAKLFG